MEEVKKEISLKDIEEAIKKVDLPKYPQYIGNGLWKLSDNTITGDRGLEAFDKAVLEQLKREYEELHDDSPTIRVFDEERLKIFFTDSSDDNNLKHKKR